MSVLTLQHPAWSVLTHHPGSVKYIIQVILHFLLPERRDVTCSEYSFTLLAAATTFLQFVHSNLQSKTLTSEAWL